MILKTYEVHNWGPHKHQILNFNPEAKTIAICAENDQGKSWILRGIAFTLSIGRNEYGDQTSIHAGETEAYHKLVIEHKNQTHTLEKRVKGKTSDNEGTKTYINNEEVDRAKFEEFYRSTLGLPHPNVWLPLTIAMQNQTDFHLRSKKSEREEALRAACQLTRIDNWKDALQTKTNEEEKALLTQGAELKGQLDTLLKTQKNLEDEKEKFLQKLQETTQPKTLGEEMPLNIILENIKNMESSQERTQKIDLEILTLKKTQELLETTLQRTQEELKKMAHFGAEEEEKYETQREELLFHLHQLQKNHLLNALKTTSKKLVEKQKEEKSLPKNLNTSLEEITKTLETYQQKTREAQALQVTIEKNLKKNKYLQESPETIQDLFDEGEKRFSKILQEKTCLKLQKADLESHLGKLESCNDACQKIQELHHKIQPLTPNSGASLALRLLEHWQNHPKNCPVCQNTLATSPLSDPKKRLLHKEKIENLLETQPDNESQTIPPIGTLTQTLKRWEKSEENLNRLTDGQPLETYLIRLKETNKELLEALHLKNENTQHQLTLINLNKEVQELLKTNTLEILLKTQAELQETLARRTKLLIEIEHLEQELQNLETTFDTLPTWLGKEFTKSEADKETLEKTLRETTEILTEKRKSRHTKSQKEKELLHTQQKLQDLKENLETHNTKREKEGNLQKTLDIPIPEQNPNLTGNDLHNYWKNLEKQREKITTLLEEIPKKIAETTKEIQNIQKDLEIQSHSIRKINSARKLLQFLDYKNAPRKLLQNIVEKLFETTNKLGKELEVDILLQAGKNLEFLTRQKRGGHWIEQKTERLGFGKGAILGVCFRLACQKLLLPDTGFLILDEPTANVDIKRKSALKTFLQNLAEETHSKTKQIILIEHDLDVIELCQEKIHIGENLQGENPLKAPYSP